MKYDIDFFNNIYRLHVEGKSDKAIKLLDSVPENHPEYPKALFYKSMLFSDEKESFDLFQKSVSMQYDQMNSDDPDKLFEIAMDYYDLDDYEEAIDYLDSVLNIEPENHEALFYKSLSLSYLDDNEQAIEVMDEAIKYCGDNDAYWMNKGVFLFEMDEYDEALKCFDKSSQLNPDNIDPIVNKALLYCYIDEHEEGFKYFDKALEMDPDDISIYLHMAEVYLELEDYEKVEEQFNKAEKIDNKNLDMISGKIILYSSTGELEKALKYCDKALKIDFSEQFILPKYMILMELEDDEKIMEFFDEIHEKNPDFLNQFNDETPYPDGDVPIMYEDENSKVYDVRGTPYSFLNKKSTKYVLDDSIIFGQDYPSGYLNYNMFNVLSEIREEEDIDIAFSKVELVNYFSEDIIKKMLVESDFIYSDAEIDVKKEVLKLSTEDLIHLLQNKGINASGKKKKLIKLAVENASPLDFTGESKVSVEGEGFLKDYAWIDIYNHCLDEFEFNDYNKYFNEHDSDDFMQMTIDYLDEHLKKAHDEEDFMYLNDCYLAKADVYIYFNEFEKALKESLTQFILMANPIYDFEECYGKFDVFDDFNVDNLILCSLNLSKNKVIELFDELWDVKISDKDYSSKNELLEYLNKSLDEEDDLMDLSEEYYDKFIADKI